MYGGYTTVVRTSARGVFFGQVGLNLEKLAAVAGFPKQLLFLIFPFVARRRTRWL